MLYGANIASYGISNKDKELFYKVVEAECTGDSYESKLAVANVIANRVNSSSFPNTISKVVKQKNQFSVIADGRYKKVKVTDSTRKAVNDCLSGKWILSDSVLYFNVKGLNSWAKKNKTYWGTVGVHDYYY